METSLVARSQARQDCEILALGHYGPAMRQASTGCIGSYASRLILDHSVSCIERVALRDARRAHGLEVI